MFSKGIMTKAAIAVAILLFIVNPVVHQHYRAIGSQMRIHGVYGGGGGGGDRFAPAKPKDSRRNIRAKSAAFNPGRA